MRSPVTAATRIAATAIGESVSMPASASDSAAISSPESVRSRASSLDLSIPRAGLVRCGRHSQCSARVNMRETSASTRLRVTGRSFATRAATSPSSRPRRGAGQSRAVCRRRTAGGIP